MRRAALAGSDAANDLGAVSRTGLGVEGAFTSGQPLHQNSCVLID